MLVLPSWFTETARAAGFMLLAGILLVAPMATARVGPSDSPAAPGDEEVELAIRLADLRRQLELASAEGFYLVLEPERGVLSLRLGANVLDEVPLQRIEVLFPRSLIGPGPRPGWYDRVWTGGQQAPMRRTATIELDASDPGFQSDRERYLIPPTPEEKYPAPRAWSVHFRDGFTLEIDSAPDSSVGSTESALGSLLRRTASNLRALFRGTTHRIRVTTSRSDADHLYRGLPPEVSFAVARERVVPGPTAPAS